MRQVLLSFVMCCISLPLSATEHATTLSHEIVAATLILEAGGEYSVGAMECVHEVIRNRAKRRKKSEVEVVLEPWQFSCWNNLQTFQGIAIAKKHPRWNEALAIASREVLPNLTGGATHYHSTSVRPYWTKDFKHTVKVGRHKFYRE